MLVREPSLKDKIAAQALDPKPKKKRVSRVRAVVRKALSKEKK